MWVLKSEHPEHGFVDFAPSICPKTSKIVAFEQKCTKTDTRTDRHTDTIHTSLSLTLSVFREHNTTVLPLITPLKVQKWPNFQMFVGVH